MSNGVGDFAFQTNGGETLYSESGMIRICVRSTFWIGDDITKSNVFSHF